MSLGMLVSLSAVTSHAWSPRLLPDSEYETRA